VLGISIESGSYKEGKGASLCVEHRGGGKSWSASRITKKHRLVARKEKPAFKSYGVGRSSWRHLKKEKPVFSREEKHPGPAHAEEGWGQNTGLRKEMGRKGIASSLRGMIVNQSEKRDQEGKTSMKKSVQRLGLIFSEKRRRLEEKEGKGGRLLEQKGGGLL